MTTGKELQCRGPPLRAKLVSVGLWCQLSLPVECVICGGDCVVMFHGLKVSTHCTGSGANQEVQSYP